MYIVRAVEGGGGGGYSRLRMAIVDLNTEWENLDYK